MTLVTRVSSMINEVSAPSCLLVLNATVDNVELCIAIKQEAMQEFRFFVHVHVPDDKGCTRETPSGTALCMATLKVKRDEQKREQTEKPRTNTKTANTKVAYVPVFLT